MEGSKEMGIVNGWDCDGDGDIVGEGKRMGNGTESEDIEVMEWYL